MTDQSGTAGNRRRGHKTTLAVVFLFVFIPWVLVAIPGDLASPDCEFYETAAGIRMAMLHGWPAVHLASNKFESPSNFPGGKYPSNYPMTGDVLRFHGVPAKPDTLFNLGFEHRERDYLTGFADSFWSDVNRWPSRYLHALGPNKSVEFQWRIAWLGLLVNMAFVGTSCLLVGWFWERRIRLRGSIFRFTIFEAMLCTLLAGGVFAWIHQCNRAAISEAAIQTFQKNSKVYTCRLMLRDPMPRMVSRLFDFSDSLPLLRPGSLRPVDSMTVSFGAGKKFMAEKESRRLFAADLNKIPVTKKIETSWMGYMPELVSEFKADSIAEFLVAYDMRQSPSLASLAPYADRTKIHVLRDIKPGDPLDISDVEEIPNLKGYLVWLVFLPETNAENAVRLADWQNEYVEQVLRLHQMNVAVFDGLNEQAGKLLLNFAPGVRLIAFGKVYVESSAEPLASDNEELVQQLIAAGYSDNINRTVSRWEEQ